MKPGPTRTRIFRLGLFLGFLGLCCPPYQHTQRGVKKFRENFAAASTPKLHQHCCCYSAPVKAAAVSPRNYSAVSRASLLALCTLPTRCSQQPAASGQMMIIIPILCSVPRFKSCFSIHSSAQYYYTFACLAA